MKSNLSDSVQSVLEPAGQTPGNIPHLNICSRKGTIQSLLCQTEGTKNPTIFNIIRWVAGLLGRSSHWPSVWCSKYFFFIISCKILSKNPFKLFFQIFYNFTKIKIKSFECPKSIRNYEKNNAWSIRRLVDESFVPSTQRIILKIVGFFVYDESLEVSDHPHYNQLL